MSRIIGHRARRCYSTVQLDLLWRPVMCLQAAVAAALLRMTHVRPINTSSVLNACCYDLFSPLRPSDWLAIGGLQSP